MDDAPVLTKVGGFQPDSTCTKGDTILDSIEKLLDKKFKPLEHRLGMLEQKSGYDRVLPLLVKIQRLVDDLVDEHESVSRKIKDEVYSVQDSLDSMSETVKDIKEDVRESLLNSDSVLEKVVKVHKHLAIAEVAKLSEKKDTNQSDDTPKEKPGVDPFQALKEQLEQQNKKLDHLEESQQNVSYIVKKLAMDQAEVQGNLLQLKEKINSASVPDDRLSSDQFEQISALIAKNVDLHAQQLKQHEEEILNYLLSWRPKDLTPRYDILEENLQAFITKKTIELKDSSMEKSSEILKAISENCIEETNARTNQFGEISKQFEELLKNLLPEITVQLAAITSTLCKVSTNVANQETDLKSCISASCKKVLEAFSKKDRVVGKALQAVSDSLDKNVNVSSEVINSIEDLKQLTSSIPNSVYDSGSKIESMATLAQEIKEKSNKQSEQLEQILVGEQQNFESIMNKFEIVEHRFGVIRKYVKNFPTAIEQPQKPLSIPNNSNQRTVVASESPGENLLNSNSSILELKMHTSSQCKILGDSIASSLDHFISALDLKKHVEELFSKLVIPMLNQIKVTCKEINEEMAKGVVVEDQLQALANTVLEPVEELKPLHDQLLATLEEELRIFSKNDSFGRLLTNQTEILSELQSLKSNPLSLPEEKKCRKRKTSKTKAERGTKRPRKTLNYNENSENNSELEEIQQ